MKIKFRNLLYLTLNCELVIRFGLRPVRNLSGPTTTSPLQALTRLESNKKVCIKSSPSLSDSNSDNPVQNTRERTLS